LAPVDALNLTVIDVVDDVITVTTGTEGRVVNVVVEDNGDIPYILVAVSAKV
jgi:hypothetical protein